MNADDKAHWLKPSPPIAVDGDSDGAGSGDASSALAPSASAEIGPSDQAAELLSQHGRMHANHVFAHHAWA